jgi:hypothetical protein
MGTLCSQAPSSGAVACVSGFVGPIGKPSIVANMWIHLALHAVDVALGGREGGVVVALHQGEEIAAGVEMIRGETVACKNELGRMIGSAGNDRGLGGDGSKKECC